jgi:hypothetical protein
MRESQGVSSVLRRIATPVAIALSAVGGVALIAPAILQLWSENVAQPLNSRIGFVASGDVKAAQGLIQINDISPSADGGNVRVFINMKLSPTTDTTEPSLDRIAASSSDFGGSVVLAGALADAIESCDAEGFKITRQVTYDSLVPDEKRVAVELFAGDDSEIVDDPDGGEDALVAAVSATYSVIRPEQWFRFPADYWSMTSDSGEERAFDGFYNYTTCTFHEDAFWTKQGVRQTFTFPPLSAVSGRLDAADAVLESRWRMQLIPTAYESLVRSDLSSSLRESGAQDFAYGGESWSGPRAVVSLRSSSLVFEDRSAKQERDVWIFIAGIGVSILGGLFASFIAWAVTRRPSRRRAQDGEGQDEADLETEAIE